MRSTPAAVVMALALFGCGEEPIEPGRLVLTSGHEPDPWTAAPAPTRARVDKVLADGEEVSIGEPDPPVSRVSLGTGAAGQFTVTGLGQNDAALVRARSLLLDPVGLAGLTLPLFVSRVDVLARPPGELPNDVGASPQVAAVAQRHLLVARASGATLTLDGYDFAAWSAIAPPPPLECGAASCDLRSLAVAQGSLVLALGDDWGFWFDPIAGDSSPIDPPDGLASFGLVAGGRAIPATDGSVYVVGGTRADAPSTAVLVIGTDGALSHLALSSPRQGAAAVWVEGRGLLVLGGGDATAAGAELLAEGAKAFVPLPQPPDETVGAAAVAWDATRVLRVGGRLGGAPAPSVELSLGCASGCQPKAVGEAVDLSEPVAFALEAERALVVGQDDSGNTSVKRWQAGTWSNVPLREPRSGASALRVPTGHVALVGGGPRTIELYVD
ncbi:MAG: hypothetical protein HYZ29_06685 [Myxococcales bacterium]|nr:hypothetical protein [Myxococcales bacterium]